MRLALSISGAAFGLVLALFWFVPYAHAGERTCGIASFYGQESGSRTYTGERFTGNDLTAAMPSTRHIGEHWRVTYQGRSVVVRINDYGPAASLHRVIDLSKEAARQLGLIPAGIGHVCMDLVTH